MQATFRRNPVEIDRHDPGAGGKPPLDRRPTGGGGEGENWGDHPRGHRGPRELLMRYRLGVLFAMSGDLMFFVALVSAFFVRQSSGHFNASGAFVSDWRPVAIPPILWLTTAVLVLSSATMEVARRQLFHEIDVMEEWLGLGRPAVKRAAPWLVATLILGLAFLAGQWLACRQLIHQGFSFVSTNPSSHFFYLITGIHGLHLAFGVCAVLFALVAMFTFHKVELRQVAVDSVAWYWHTITVFWIFLFLLLVFFQ